MLGVVFIDQDRHPAIDVFGEFSILFTAEDRAGAGVGIDEGNIFGRELKMALFIAEIGNAVGKEDEVGWRDGEVARWGGGEWCAECEEAEFVAVMHSGENTFPVFKVIEADQGAGVGEILKEEFGGVVGGDAAGNDATTASLSRKQDAVKF